MYGFSGSPLQFGAKCAKQRIAAIAPLDLKAFFDDPANEPMLDLMDKHPELQAAVLQIALRRAFRLLQAIAEPVRSHEMGSEGRGAGAASDLTSDPAFDLSFSDLRRCSTADQSGIPDLEDFQDGH